MKSGDLHVLESLLRDARLAAGRSFSDGEVATLAKYYELVLKWNPRLHLTTLTKPKDFFERHLLESHLAAQQILTSVESVWDLGSGLGIPGLVIAVLRPDLPVSLVEANRKKAIFLDEAAANLGLANVLVFGSRFETLEPAAGNACVTARAVEEMEKLVPEILGFGRSAAQILLFGNESIVDRIRRNVLEGWEVGETLIPGTDRRYLFNVICST